eukprot:TCALIF_02706-PA protein Name:"Protein of unknown function" AED:0.34 eAED:0.34 QI:0/1/0.33/1/1/0.66/3/0/382
MNRRSVVLSSGLGSETAKYNREVALKEISKSFNDDFRQNQMKYHHTDPNEIEADRMNKARSKILGPSSGPTAYLDDHFERRAAVSDLFGDTQKFSSRTVAAVGNLLDRNAKKDKKDYAWRKDIEDYEKSSEFGLQQKLRSYESRNRKRREEELQQSNRRQAETKPASTHSKPPLAPAAKSLKIEHDTFTKPSRKIEPVVKAEKSIPIKIEQKAEIEKMDTTSTVPTKPKGDPEAVVEPMEAKKKKVITTKKVKKPAGSGSEDAVLKSVDNTALIDTKLSDSEANAQTKTESTSEPVKATVSVQDENVAPDTTEGPPKEAQEEEGDDVHGTKKMRSDFDTKMDSLAAEMEAGRSKLAKLRERIRKAKGAIKEADDAMAKTMKT